MVQKHNFVPNKKRSPLKLHFDYSKEDVLKQVSNVTSQQQSQRNGGLKKQTTMSSMSALGASSSRVKTEVKPYSKKKASPNDKDFDNYTFHSSSSDDRPSPIRPLDRVKDTYAQYKNYMKQTKFQSIESGNYKNFSTINSSKMSLSPSQKAVLKRQMMGN